MGNSAFRFCLLMQWHTATVWPTQLFPDNHKKGDEDMVSVCTPSETDQDFLARNWKCLSCSCLELYCPRPGNSSSSRGALCESQHHVLARHWNFSTNELRTFRSQHGTVLDRIPTQNEPLETLAPLILQAIYDERP